MSAVQRIADSSRTSRHVRLVPIVLQKSFEGDERNFPGPLMRFARRDVGGPHRFSEKRPRSFVSALQSIATMESSKHQRLRDFWRRSIFDFCNTICQQQTKKAATFDAVWRFGGTSIRQRF
jgi:hypothetical protein